MRILHTADWHLGKIVNEYSMIEDQQHYLHELIEKVKPMNLDAMIMAGDLYDRSLPPKEAVALADEIMTRIVNELKIPFFVISGNHDSQERVEYGSRLFAENRVYMEGTAKPTTRKVTIDDTNFYLLPFVEPVQAREIFQDATIRTMEDVARQQMAGIKQDFDSTMINVLIAHGYVINGTADSVETSESERPLTIGTAEYIPVELFEDFDYVALGHLHQPQKVKNDHIRYSGSILKYSKSEANHQKKALLVDLSKSSCQVEPILIEPLRDLRILRGMFDDLLQGSSTDYIFFELEDRDVIFDPMNQLRLRYPNAMGLEYINRSHLEISNLSHTQEDLKQQSFPDLFVDFYEDRTKTELNEEEIDFINQAFFDAERSLYETP